METVRAQKQGQVFTIKPPLLCASCNGFFGKIEDEMVKFAKPIFTTLDSTVLTPRQTRVMIVWLSCIFGLIEHIRAPHATITIPKSDLMYLKKTLWPPPSWSIFYCSVKGEVWRQQIRRHYMTLFSGPMGGIDSPIRFDDPNTQIASIGMGNLFAQMFTCPIDNTINDYRIAARTARLTQLWPTPNRFGLFPQKTAKFPTGLVLGDDQAGTIADSFFNRTQFLLRNAHERGRPLY